MSRIPSDLHRRIAAALTRVETVMRAQEQKAAQATGISPLQLRVLEALERKPHLRVGELARELLITTGTVSAAVSVLQAKGLITKESDPEEHRAVVIRLSAKARRRIDKLASWPSELLEPVVDDLGDDAAGELLAGLLRALHAIERRGWIDPARMCYRCEYFQPWKGSGRRPHRCDLLRKSIGSSELRVDCAEFEAASGPGQEARWKAIGHTP